MYHLFLKIATRYLIKNRLYSVINIAGLTIGVASFILIMIYVNHEKSYDKFDGSENVYRVYMDYLEGDVFVPGDAQAYNLSGPTLKKEFPEISDQVRLYKFDKVTFVYKDKVLEERHGALADASYFNVFNRSILLGDTKKILTDPYTVMLSESLSKKIFGDENPIGKKLSIFDAAEAKVSVVGVFEDVPKNTHMKTNFLVSFDTFKTWGAFEGQNTLNWNQNNFFTYLKVRKSADIVKLKEKIMNHKVADLSSERHNIEPLESIHLYSNKPYEAEANGSAKRIQFLLAIAIIIILLSWLNYINLSTTKSLERAKEIGIRKVAGAKKTHLILQSLLESLLLNFIAISIALVLVIALLPVFSNYIDKDLYSNIFKPEIILTIIGFLFFGALLSGLYPAVVLSNYTPIKALKEKIQTSPKGLTIRKGLIVLQFFATTVLLIGTIVVSKQINFLQDQPIGTNLNQIIALNGTVYNEQEGSSIKADYKTLKTELKKIPAVTSVSFAQTYPGDGYDNLSSAIGITYPNGTKDDKHVFYNYQVDSEYFDLLGMEFLAGKPFIETTSGKSNQVVINEKFARKMGITDMENALNKTIKFWGIERVISGVLKDYHHFGLKKPIEPLIIRHQYTNNNLLVKLDQSALKLNGFSEAIAQIEAKWKAVMPNSTFNYTFLDKKFEAQYAEDKSFKTAFQIFTFLAILIASMGLFGLTSYTCLQRRREIGVRKVLGASVSSITSLLAKDFMKLVFLGILIGSPMAWYLMDNWLMDYAYRINMPWWAFGMAGIAASAIALFTISFESIKAASSNPIKNLKTE